VSATFAVDEQRLARALLDRNLVTPSQIRQCMQILERKRAQGGEDSLGHLLVVKRFLDELALQMVVDSLRGEAPPLSIPGVGSLEPIGARAYRGRQDRAGREVVVKVYPGTDDRFLQEIRRAAGHIHRHLATVYDVGRSGDACFVVIERIRGESFDSMIRRGFHPPQRELVEWGLQMAEALDYLGTRGACHGDLNPSRVIVSDAGTVKLIGAGVLRPLKELQEDPFAVASTPSEVLSGAKPPRLRADIYSLGATLFQVATGVPPYDGSTVRQVIASQQEGRLLDAQALNPELSVPFRMILGRCLADRSARYHGPRELVKDLRSIESFVKSAEVDIPVAPVASPQTRKSTAKLRIPPPPIREETDFVEGPAAAREPRPSRAREIDPERSLVRSLGTVAIVAVVLVGALIAYNFVSRYAGSPRKPTPAVPTARPDRETGPTASAEDEAEALHRQAADHMRAGRWSQAREALDRIQNEFALTRFAVENGAVIHDGLTLCYKALARERGAAATGRWKSAEAAFHDGRYLEARGLYREIAQAESDQKSIEVKIATERARHCDEELNVEEIWTEATKAFDVGLWEVVEGAAITLLEKHGGSHTVKRRAAEIAALRSRAREEVQAALVLASAAKAVEEKRWPDAEAALKRLDVEFPDSKTFAGEREPIEAMRGRVTAAVRGIRGEEAAAHLARAREAFDKRDFAGARSLYEEAVRKFGALPEFPAEEVKSRIAASEEQFKRQRELRAAHAHALARSHARTEEWDKALQWFQVLLVDYADTAVVQARRAELEATRDAAAEAKKAAAEKR
jgi:serine/threonine protein kinase